MTDEEARAGLGLGKAPATLFEAQTPQGGVIRLEQWPEGFVLWHHGEIVWRSPPVCPTCNGRGEVGGFQFGETCPGYVTDPCPDCQPPAAR